jgi:hypothetical protein
MNDLDRALDAALGFARRMLVTKGAFVPFAAVIDGSGLAYATLSGKTRGGDPDQLAARLVAEIRERRHDLWVVALTTNREVADLGSVVHVDLEHRNGPSAVILLPYSARRRGRKVEFGEPQRLAGEPVVWPRPAPPNG